MKLLVTDGAGFTCSAVIRHILQKTEDKMARLDKLNYVGSPQSLIQWVTTSALVRKTFNHDWLAGEQLPLQAQQLNKNLCGPCLLGMLEDAI